MSASDSEENYSKHQHKKHKKRRSSSDLFREYKKKHKSHKRKSNDSHYDQKRRKLKEESKDFVKVKSEPRDRHEEKLLRAEAKERENSKRDNRLLPSERSARHGGSDSQLTVIRGREHPQARGSSESHSSETFEESSRTEVQDQRLPEQLKAEIGQLLVLGVDKDRVHDYVCNVIKKPLDRKALLNICAASVKYQKEVSKDRALVLIQKVYDVGNEEEAEQIFQNLSMNKPLRKSRKQGPEEFAGDLATAFGSEGKKIPKTEHGNRDRGQESRGEGESTKNKKSTKATGGVEKPNFSLSGKLAEDTNIFNGVVVKYSEPPEARMPKKRWRLYPFKGDQGLPTLYIHRQSAYLLGRDRKVADIPIDHPSCSKQHAALQYRLVTYQRSDGSTGKQIRLYLIDLESANGTYINNNKIEPRKYVELFEKDVIKFGFSSREYVLLHEHSKDDDDSENES